MEEFNLGANFASIMQSSAASESSPNVEDELPNWHTSNYEEKDQTMRTPDSSLRFEAVPDSPDTRILRNERPFEAFELSALSKHNCKVEERGEQVFFETKKVLFSDNLVGVYSNSMSSRGGPLRELASAAPALFSAERHPDFAVNGSHPCSGKMPELPMSLNFALAISRAPLDRPVSTSDAAAELEMLLSPLTRGSSFPNATILTPPSPSRSELQVGRFHLNSSKQNARQQGVPAQNERARLELIEPQEMASYLRPAHNPYTSTMTEDTCTAPAFASAPALTPMKRKLSSPLLTSKHFHERLQALIHVAPSSGIEQSLSFNDSNDVQRSHSLSPSPALQSSCNTCGTLGCTPAAHLSVLACGSASISFKTKEHTCGDCGISFAAKCNLFKHQRAVRKFTCSSLSSRVSMRISESNDYSNDNDLSSFNVNHVYSLSTRRKDLGLRPYSCTLCSSAFSERNKLQKHILTVRKSSSIEQFFLSRPLFRNVA
jgi:hypothetical protein